MKSLAPWTPEFELEYVRQTNKGELLSRVLHFAEVFDLPLEIDGVIADVGCGAIGGMLSVIQAERCIAIDPLVEQYALIGMLPKSLERVSAYAHEIPLKDGEVHTLFCIEALDHCEDMVVFEKSVGELSRILKSGGLLYFMLPSRSGPRDGHPCNPDSRTVEAMFEAAGLDVVRRDYPKKEGIWRCLLKR